MAEDALTLDVVVEPGAQSRPRPRQRLVGEPDGARRRWSPVARRRVARSAARDQRRSPGCVGAPAAGSPRRRRRGDEAQQHVAQQRPPLWQETLVDRLGGLGDRAADATAGPIAVDRQRSPLTPLPGLAQRMRHQRQGARFAFHLTHEEIDQSWFEQQAGLTRRTLDRRPQVRPRPSPRAGTGRARSSWRTPGRTRRRRDGRRARPRQAANARTCRRGSLKNRVCSAGSVQSDTASSHWSTTSTESPLRRKSPCSASIGAAPGVTTTTRRPSRRSAAATPARTSDDFPLPDGPTTTSTPFADSRRRHSPTSTSRPKKPSASSTSNGTRPRYGHSGLATSGRCRRRRGPGSWRRIACSNDEQVRPGIDAQLGGQRSARLAQRAQRLALTAGLVLGQGEQRPAPLAQRLPGDERLGARANTSRCRPLCRQASTRSSSTSRRICSSRAASIRAGSQRSASASGWPRHSASASPSTYAARSGLAEGQQLTRLGHGLLEARHVDVVGEQRQPIAVRRRLDRFGAECTAQPHDATGDDLVPRLRRLVPPQRIGQLAGADDASRPRRQRRQHDTIARGPNETPPPSIESGPNSAIRAAPIGEVCMQREAAVNLVDNRLIPRRERLDTAWCDKCVHAHHHVAGHRHRWREAPAAGGPTRPRRQRRRKRCGTRTLARARRQRGMNGEITCGQSVSSPAGVGGRPARRAIGRGDPGRRTGGRDRRRLDFAARRRFRTTRRPAAWTRRLRRVARRGDRRTGRWLPDLGPRPAWLRTVRAAWRTARTGRNDRVAGPFDRRDLYDVTDHRRVLGGGRNRRAIGADGRASGSPGRAGQSRLESVHT